MSHFLRRLFSPKPPVRVPRPAFVPLFPGARAALLHAYQHGYADAQADEPLDPRAYGDAACAHQYRDGWQAATRGDPPAPDLDPVLPPEPEAVEFLTTAPTPRGLVDHPELAPTLLPSPSAITGPGWQPIGAADAVSSHFDAPRSGAAVICHRLRVATDYSNFMAYGCYIPGLAAGEVLRLSAWVYIQAGAAPRQVAMNCAGHAALLAHTADLAQTDRWQQIWTISRVPADPTDVFAVLCIIGDAGSEVHSSDWALEATTPP